MKKTEMFQQLVQSAGKLDKVRLGQVYGIAELFRRAAESDGYEAVTDVEQEKACLIRCIMRLGDAKALRRVNIFAHHM